MQKNKQDMCIYPPVEDMYNVAHTCTCANVYVALALCMRNATHVGGPGRIWVAADAPATVVPCWIPCHGSYVVVHMYM